MAKLHSKWMSIYFTAYRINSIVYRVPLYVVSTSTKIKDCLVVFPLFSRSFSLPLPMSLFYSYFQLSRNFVYDFYIVLHSPFSHNDTQMTLNKWMWYTKNTNKIMISAYWASSVTVATVLLWYRIKRTVKFGPFIEIINHFNKSRMILCAEQG